MKRPLLSFLLIVLVLTALPLGLGAAITATYTPEYPIFFKQSPGVFTHSTIAGAKIGTITILSDGPIYNPAFMTIGDMSIRIEMRLSHKDYEFGTHYETTKSFYVVSVAYPNGRGGTPVVVTTPYNKLWPILSSTQNETVTTSPFYVDLYIINKNPGPTTSPGSVSTFESNGAYIEFNSPITFVTPFNPSFSIGSGTSASQGIYQYGDNNTGEVLSGTTNGDYIELNNVNGPLATPLLDPSGYTTGDDGEAGYWFGDENAAPKPLNFLFSFLENTVSFTLSEAYGTNNKVTINTAQMQVQNGVSGTTYTQKLTFTDSTNAAAFQLSPTSGSGTPIDFKLYFGGVEMTKGSPHNWTGLVPGMNTKILQVGGINATLAEQRVSGAYSDTITVNITAGP